MATNQQRTLNTGSWSGLLRELNRRTVEPIYHASFVIYCVVAVLIVGGAGVWLELCVYFVQLHVAPGKATLAALRTASITFFPALAGAACLQLIWAEDRHRSLRAFAILVLFVTSILALVIGSVAIIQDWAALAIAAAASVLALWMWWIANANQKDLLDPPNPDAATGGDANAAPAGDLSGFKV